MISLLSEFDSTLVGVAVFAENAQEQREKMAYKSLLRVSEIDVKNNRVLNAPVKLILRTLSKSSTVILSINLSLVIPALLTSTSTLPRLAIASLIMRLASSKEETSPEIAITFTP
ncbi:pur operon repressor [Streptococcus agalactiae 515]|nr:pur operon repressor [Streptococcus agalactiae 515]